MCDIKFLFLIFFFPAVAFSVELDFKAYDDSSLNKVTQVEGGLKAIWKDKAGIEYSITFNSDRAKPLISKLEVTGEGNKLVTVATGLNPRYHVSLGSRNKDNWPYKFFDKVDTSKPMPVGQLSELQLQKISVISESQSRTRIEFSPLKIGPYSGVLNVTVYHGSPMVRLQATMKITKDWVAYIYDSVVFADYETVSYKDAKSNQLVLLPGKEISGSLAKNKGIQLKHRTIMGKVAKGEGTIAVFPPPHAAFYPLDLSDNFGYAQAGKGFIGTRMPPKGDHRWRPWVNAPNGSLQKMDSFLLISAESPEKTLNKVLKYTNGDFFKPIPGRFTMTEHFHPEITVNQRKDTASPFKKTMQSIGLQIAQLKEFHLGGGFPFHNMDGRLQNMKAMYELCKKHSDDSFVFIPGEEYNRWLGGHWSYIFPEPVYFTGWRNNKNRPFLLEKYEADGVVYDKVYQIENAEDFRRLLEAEGGLGWTAHPRIKGARKQPDAYINTDFYRSSNFQLGDWKSMPLNLSDDRLGMRCFQLMDETAQWGYDKKIMGAADTFYLYPDHEIYAHLVVNYMKLSKIPNANEWHELVDCIRKGDYFTTTGEVLIHSWKADVQGVTADVEWYFPPEFAEITWGSKSGVQTKKVKLYEHGELDRKSLRIEADLSEADWVRFEAWDVARNGAFTQLYWFKPAANPKNARTQVTGFTLIDANTDAPVPGFDPIPAGAVLNLSQLPKNLTIKCNTTPMIVDEVVVQFEKKTRLLRKYPYSLGPVRKWNYEPMQFRLGDYTISASCKLGGHLGESTSLTFTVKEK